MLRACLWGQALKAMLCLSLVELGMDSFCAHIYPILLYSDFVYLLFPLKRRQEYCDCYFHFVEVLIEKKVPKLEVHFQEYELYNSLIIGQYNLKMDMK